MTNRTKPRAKTSKQPELPAPLTTQEVWNMWERNGRRHETGAIGMLLGLIGVIELRVAKLERRRSDEG
jgi:hypothetical protein